MYITTSVPRTNDSGEIFQLQNSANKLAGLQRYETVSQPTYLSRWEQACFKYLFPGAFDASIDVGELQLLGTFGFSILLNIVSVHLNVFGGHTATGITSTDVAAMAVFIFEYVVVVSTFLLALLIAGEAWWTRKLSTDTAVDLVEVTQQVSGFSALKIVRLVSPQLVTGWIFPLFQNARSTAELARGACLAFGWLVCVGFSCLAVVLKVSQVGFVTKIALTEWTFSQFLLLFGLVLNLAKVDASYDTEMASLLRSLHCHFAGPGGPASLNEKSEGLYSKFLKFVGVERPKSFEYFEAIFDEHFGTEMESCDADKIRRFINFLAFLLKLDCQLLSRLLHMIRSPLSMYVAARADFQSAVTVEDVECAIRRADPCGSYIKSGEELSPDAFFLFFRCTV